MLAGICIITPMVAFVGLLGVNRVIEASPGAVQVQSALQLHADEVRHCEGIGPLQPGKQENCSWRVPKARGRVLLLGDSNAGQFTEPAVKAANAAGYDLTVATLAACPFVDLRIYSDGVPNQRCQDFVAGALDEIERLRPSLIILAAATDGYIEEPSTTLRVTTQSGLAQTPSDKARLWTIGLSAVLARMNNSGPVLLVHPIPRFRTWTLAGCASYKLLFDPMSCAGTSTRSEVDGWRQRAVKSEAAAIAQHPGTAALELTDVLCPLPTCTVSRGDVWIFRDGAHLSVPGSLTLADEFAAAIKKHARP